MVHEACLAAEGCPVPHPVELRLGRGKRLRQIDETGRFGAVGSIFGGDAELLDLISRQSLDSLPGEYQANLVEYMGGWAVGRELALRAAATYFKRELASEQFERVYVDPLLYVARITPHGLVEGRFLERPDQPLGYRMRVSRDSRWAVWSGDSRFDIIDLEQRIKPRSMDLKGQMVFDLALSSSMDLVALAQWGQANFFGLSDGWRVGKLRRENDDFTCVLLGGGRVVYFTGGKSYSVFRVDRKTYPDKWERVAQGKIKASGQIRARDASLSPDGKLLAVRRRKKEAWVLDLESGNEQILTGHTDRINLVRFINNGRRLITADDDNRVIIWPRQEDRIISGE